VGIQIQGIDIKLLRNLSIDCVNGMAILHIGSLSWSEGPPAWFADTVRIDPSSQENAGCLFHTTQLLFSNCTRVLVWLHSLSPFNHLRKRLSLPTLLCGDSQSKSLPTSRHHDGYRASGHFQKLIWVTSDHWRLAISERRNPLSHIQWAWIQPLTPLTHRMPLPP
jgi:hypothetical protein